MPTNELTNVGWVLNVPNVEHLAWSFRNMPHVLDLLDTEPMLDSKQLERW